MKKGGDERKKQEKKGGKRWNEFYKGEGGKLKTRIVIDYGLKKSTRKKKIQINEPRRKKCSIVENEVSVSVAINCEA